MHNLLYLLNNKKQFLAIVSLKTINFQYDTVVVITGKDYFVKHV